MTSNLPRWAGDSTTPFVLHLAQDLQALGWQVDVLAPHAPGAATRETLDGVNVERFRYLWPESQQTVCYQGGALINLRKSRANWLKLPALIGAELAAVALRLAARRYDLLHSHWTVPQGFVGMLTRWIGAVPHVVTVHGGDVFGLRGPLLAAIKRGVLRSADAVTVNSRYTGDAVERLAGPSARMHRIPMGVSIPAGPPPADVVAALRDRLRYGAGPLLVFAGRLVEEKGAADVIHAVDLLRRDLPDVRAVIIGEGQDRAGLERLVAELGLGAHVSFTGWVQPGEIGRYLAAGDVFVGPSRRARDGWVEAQGLAPLEAMAAGVPAIVSDLGGVTDAVEHEHTGLIVNERAPEQIADAVRRLRASPELHSRIVAAASQRVRAEFSREASACAFSELFGRLVRP